MSKQIACARSIARAVVAFLVLVGIVTAVAATKGMGSLKPLPQNAPLVGWRNGTGHREFLAEIATLELA